jgi:thiol-disulfide isomerase/thioredoxin
MQKGSVGIAVVIAVVLLVAGGMYLLSTRENKKTERMAETVTPTASVVADDTQKAEQNGMYTGALLAGSAAPLLDFTKADYEHAKASDKLVMLYFYATWCPICTKETANALFPAFNELTDERVVGFRVNYNDSDTDADERALAREFGVGYQHTKVFLRNAERILKSPESWNKERYLSEIKKALQ